MDASSCWSAGIHGEFRVSAAQAEKPSFSTTPQRNFSWGFTFRHPLKTLWPVGKTRYEPAMALDHAVLAKEKPETKACEEQTSTNGNWVYRIWHVRSLWKEEEKRNGGLEEEARAKLKHDDEIRVQDNNEYDFCAINDDDDDEKIEFDRESFSKLLRKVPLAEARLYAQISYLGTLAYSIPQIKPGNLLRYHGFRFVTSSLEKKEHSLKLEKENVPAEENSVCCDNVDTINQEMASLMAKEEIKQGVDDDLNSTRSSPCEWFICDDDQSFTRFFVVQGSESMASWQANLLFEPIQFEGLDVLVHRGIYEAAKRIYEQFLPEIHAHIKSHGDQAKLRFTGHSLGGSLSVLVNLMLLIRGEVPRSSLLPVITYGAPSTMCGGDRLLNNLGLPRNHVRSITMHRDIVPRAFSCNYPNHVAGFLKVVNGNFRNHPCLNKQKLLFAPMGEFLILQPDDTFSPNHDLLPSGSGLYILTCPASDLAKAEKQIRAAQTVFLNCPHPLEILSDRSAYGSEGTIQRDHDMASYLKSVRSSIRQELNRIRKAKRENSRNIWWPLVSTKGVIGISVSRAVNNMGRGESNFAGFVQTSRKSLKRFSTLVASQHMHLLVVLLFPARLLELGTCSLISIC